MELYELLVLMQESDTFSYELLIVSRLAILSASFSFDRCSHSEVADCTAVRLFLFCIYESVSEDSNFWPTNDDALVR